ncbi:DHA2 family efflux MFS transporter permease subunit [Corynebacterium tapiri]|uniref:DHA2 family efflux MFS transporter permease subunit n=1 Tax=Corynebacterium tapiri TaxID=1448266 RepID=A0A5C4U3P6_9CORY|nr:DHA2 family efflux MFS transporter permease subunit [Corynebacterium tapiri]TNL96049.1 DHA2 family efflux MFS transporter permease subunit [Corynebacterium tapiri]
MAEHTQHTIPRRSIVAIMAVLVLAATVMVLNETTLAVALPAIMADFGVSADVVQWLLTGFMLTMAVVIPTTGYLIQRLSTRAIFFAAMTLFTLGSILGATAPVFGMLLLARVVQAAGTAIMIPLLMTTTLTIIPVEKRGTVMGLISVVISVAPALGPTLSGMVLEHYTWHHLFWLMVPIALLTLVFSFFALINVGETRSIPLDVVSVLLSVVAFGALVYGLSTIGSLLDASSHLPAIALVVGVLTLAVFVTRQLSLARRERALLDLSAFTVKTFSWSVVAVVAGMAVMLGTVSILPIYLQGALGASALATGLVLLPGGLIMGAISPLIGRIYDSVGPRPLTIPGSVLMLITQFWMAFTFTEHTPLWQVVLVVIVFNVGMAMVMTPLMTVSLSALPMKLYSHGSAIMSTLQQLGGAAGTALFVAALTVGQRSVVERGPAAATAEGVTGAYFLGGLLALVIVVACVFVAGQRAQVHEVKEEPAGI